MTKIEEIAGRIQELELLVKEEKGRLKSQVAYQEMLDDDRISFENLTNNTVKDVAIATFETPDMHIKACARFKFNGREVTVEAEQIIQPFMDRSVSIHHSNKTLLRKISENITNSILEIFAEQGGQ